MGSDITYSSNDNRVYYRSTNGTSLKYFWNGNSYSPSPSINNCAGYLSIDQFGNVFYKGTDGKIHVYLKSGGYDFILTTNTNVKGGVNVKKNGGQLYYQGTDNNLWKVTYTNFIQSTAIKCTTSNNVTENISLDNNSGRAFFRCTDNRIYNYYNTSGNNWSIDALTWDLEDANATGQIVYDNLKEILYYIGTGNRLYCLFNDGGWNISGGGKWYNTPIQFDMNNVGDQITLRYDGVILYRGSDSKLYWATEKNNEIINPECYPNFDNPKPIYNIHNENGVIPITNNKFEIEQFNMNLDLQSEFKVYPNPARNSFQIEYPDTNNEPVYINIYSLNNIKIKSFQEKGTCNNGTCIQSLDISDLENGFYILKINNNWLTKLIKL